MIRGIILVGLLLIPARASELSRFKQAARRITQDIDAGRYSAPVERLTDDFRRALPPEKAGPFFRSVADGYGKTLSIEHIRIESPGIAAMSVRCIEGTYEFKLWLDDRDRIAGLSISPHPIDVDAPKRNVTSLSLPFLGRWLVVWGGDTIDQNYHSASVNQKFSFDLLVIDSKASSHKGAGKMNSDYYAYGRDILAPGDGMVIRVVEGIPENIPGDMEGKNLLGNAVFIQHSPDETSILAHMIPGSIRVKEGQKVGRGDLLGKCGNSGHSSEPHLHYHLQNAPRLKDGKGIKVFFSSVVVSTGVKTESKTDYSPVQMEIISPE